MIEVTAIIVRLKADRDFCARQRDDYRSGVRLMAAGVDVADTYANRMALIASHLDEAIKVLRAAECN